MTHKKQTVMSRRNALFHGVCGFGGLALRSLLGADTKQGFPLAPKAPHFPGRAKRVIFLCMHGGPSSIDSFDPKPRLIRDNGKPVPFQRGLTFAANDVGNLTRSPWQFRSHGQSGIEVSDLWPHVASCVDDLCVIRSNPYGYTMWMAGGGVKAGMVYGATDEFGYNALENRMHIHDLHATILHLLGLDHERLTYFYAGRNYRLTDVHGEVARNILA